MAREIVAFASVALGRERLAPAVLPRHRHNFAYATVVLDGGYEEAGDRGRWLVGAGDVLFHHAFEAHLDRVDGRGADVVNLPLPADWPMHDPAGRVGDPERIVRAAERSRADALLELAAQVMPIPDGQTDWPDRLALALASNFPPSIANWASANRLNPSTAARGFRRIYGVSPRRFRAEARVRRALRMVISNEWALAAVAADSGFADQAHMTRSVRALTGRTPGQWQRRV